MQSWSVRDAKAKFSRLLQASVAQGPQRITNRGTEVAVLVSVEEWRRLQAAARPTLKDLLLSDDARGDFVTPLRGRDRRRPIAPFD
jgi:antitoxin Phd